MEKAVDEFNEEYDSDLSFLDFDYLKCDPAGVVDLSEVLSLQSLTEAFFKIANRADEGYYLHWLPEGRICLKRQ